MKTETLAETLNDAEDAFQKAEADLAELTSLKSAQTSKVLQLRGDFVEDKSPEKLDELQVEESKLTSLQNSLDLATDELTRFEKELTAARAAVAENKLLGIAKGFAVEAAKLGKDYIESYTILIKVLETSGELLEKLQAFRSIQHQYRQSRNGIENVSEKLRAIGVTGEELYYGTAEKLDLPNSEYHSIIDTLLRIAIQKKEYAAWQKRSEEKYASTGR